jgi:hypothetical protein
VTTPDIDRIAKYSADFNEAARIACTTYLNGVAAYGDHRRHQEFDNLDETGKAVWRAVAMRAAEAMNRADVDEARARLANTEALLDRIRSDYAGAVGHEWNGDQ